MSSEKETTFKKIKVLIVFVYLKFRFAHYSLTHTTIFDNFYVFSNVSRLFYTDVKINTRDVCTFLLTLANENALILIRVEV